MPDEQWPHTDVFPPSDITESEFVKNFAATTRVLGNTTDCVASQIDEVIGLYNIQQF